jgi:hypothetical protein
MVHQKLGDSSKAEDYYQKALQWLSEHLVWQGGVSSFEFAKPFLVEAAALLGKEPVAR